MELQTKLLGNIQKSPKCKVVQEGRTHHYHTPRKEKEESLAARSSQQRTWDAVD